MRICTDIFRMPQTQTELFYEIYQSLVRLLVNFMNKGKQYDPKVTFDEMFKAGRLLQTIIAIQVQFDAPLEMTDAIFGYNMLYPYTDDFVDCPSVPGAAKKEFAQVFHERLRIGEPDYDPNVHFDGRPSPVNAMRLPESLKPYGDQIEKIFDMVRFVENGWKRRGENECVYMSLATIHDSQIKSTLQHAPPTEGYAPTMSEIERVSADKGGASLIAAGFLVKGRLTRAKTAYLEYLGFGMQLVDDLQVSSLKRTRYSCMLSIFQDVEIDMKNNHRTIFTQSIAEGKMLDAPTARLIRYCCKASAYETFAVDDLSQSGTESQLTLPRYAYAVIIKACLILILEAASRLQQYYSRDFYRELSSFSPLPFSALKKIRIEDKLMTIILNHWF